MIIKYIKNGWRISPTTNFCCKELKNKIIDLSLGSYYNKISLWLDMGCGEYDVDIELKYCPIWGKKISFKEVED